MNFELIESKYVDWNKIHEDFSDDFLFSSLSNEEIRIKYDMTHKEFKEFTNIVKSENNITRRPYWKLRNNKGVNYYYKCKCGFQIRKRIGGQDVYLGIVPSELDARKIVQLCINASWNIEVCKKIIDNWKKHIV